MNEFLESKERAATWLKRLEVQPLLSIFRCLMVVYLFFLVVLPSGSLLGVNVKVVCFVALLPFAVQVSLARHQMTTRRLILLLGVPAALFFWCFLSQLYGFDSAQTLAQYKDVLVTMATCWFAAVLCNNDRREALFLLRWVLYIEVASSTLKILLLAYAFARGIPVSQLIDLIAQVFGVRLMAFDLESLLGRLQFISDNLIPLCIYALLCYRRALSFGVRYALPILLVMLISDLFSFSRYLWVFTVLAVVCGLCVGRKDRFQLGLVIGTGLIVIFTLPTLITVVTLRFSSAVADPSDLERTEQVVALKTFFSDAPWLGHGFGSYTTRVLRDIYAPYSYEAQLLALAGQVGLIGVCFLVLLTALFLRRMWPIRRASVLRSGGLFVLLIVWMANGFFNPSVISSAAAVSYVAFYAMGNLEALTELQ